MRSVSEAALPSSRSERQREIARLEHYATKLRILSIEETTKAGSGHPTSCASAADVVAALFFRVMRRNDDGTYLDRFVLSKGHAAPLLYAAWAEAGAIPHEALRTLRKVDSDLEGHPTPRLPFVDVATGSLGQGLPAAIGLALDAKYLSKTDSRTYVLLGDGECAEGSVWEAAGSARDFALGNLCVIVDVNQLGQSGPTRFGDDIEAQAKQWSAFGWKAIPADGNDLESVLDAFEAAEAEKDVPCVILALTQKGAGIPDIEGAEDYHGKALTAEQAKAAIGHLQQKLSTPPPEFKPAAKPPASPHPGKQIADPGPPPYRPGQKPIATRKAFGQALAALAKASPDIVVLDADVENSTYTELADSGHGRSFQMFIAEQNMVGTAMGLAAAGRVPFAATFACFFTRAYDFLRMAAIGNNNIKLAGTHAGVSIGEDGPSQMGLEDLAMCCAQPNFTVLHPSDATSAWRATHLAATVQGPAYLRLTRPETAVLYGPDETFEVGRCKVIRQSSADQVTVVAAGVTLFEALSAHDSLAKEGISTRVIDVFSVQPLDRDTLRESIAHTKGRFVVVEDHYRHGGLGHTVCAALMDAGFELRGKHLAVDAIPRSGSREALLDKFGISAPHIARAVRDLL